MALAFGPAATLFYGKAEWTYVRPTISCSVYDFIFAPVCKIDVCREYWYCRDGARDTVPCTAAGLVTSRTDINNNMRQYLLLIRKVFSQI